MWIWSFWARLLYCPTCMCIFSSCKNYVLDLCQLPRLISEEIKEKNTDAWCPHGIRIINYMYNTPPCLTWIAPNKLGNNPHHQKWLFSLFDHKSWSKIPPHPGANDCRLWHRSNLILVGVNDIEWDREISTASLCSVGVGNYQYLSK